MEKSTINTRNDRRKNATNLNGHLAKIPPQAIDLEEVVLGAMMVDKRGVDEVKLDIEF